MLDVAAFVLFAWLAYRVVTSVRRESAIFVEFGQTTAVAYTALLFPLGPLLMLLVGIRAPIPAIVLCAACYVPSLVLARRASARFERAGTDRVRNASAAVSEAFGAAIAGLVYAALILVFIVGVNILRGPTDA